MFFYPRHTPFFLVLHPPMQERERFIINIQKPKGIENRVAREREREKERESKLNYSYEKRIL